MKNFYFTFGTDDSYPFRGGWVLIRAKDRSTACRMFKILYPHKTEPDILNCAFVYSEPEFLATSMAADGENLGTGLQESWCLIDDFHQRLAHLEDTVAMHRLDDSLPSEILLTLTGAKVPVSPEAIGQTS